MFNIRANYYKESYLRQNLLYLSKKRPKRIFNSFIIPNFDFTENIGKEIPNKVNFGSFLMCNWSEFRLK